MGRQADWTPDLVQYLHPDPISPIANQNPSATVFPAAATPKVYNLQGRRRRAEMSSVDSHPTDIRNSGLPDITPEQQPLSPDP
ncbi:hypothetical protein BO94DRAFT_267579 [Aspergillus sclerotioniger CBS 115572]|uniref:Uncharacterized protein n=1 Tax=Aspergillus sclerotioniger CBS 115572 TaxID=1450535 RepID=A0A317VCZ8_9EURO|nr:hypothetical protein BO94DRAFT_267579 [Aspergillus sclerotioniger CBS 115572]PWY70878.1 hypothetical protein BO94DRAFT_267579 [Aspergillus sclerotioniger CBS 115572]